MKNEIKIKRIITDIFEQTIVNSSTSMSNFVLNASKGAFVRSNQNKFTVKNVRKPNGIKKHDKTMTREVVGGSGKHVVTGRELRYNAVNVGGERQIIIDAVTKVICFINKRN